MREKLRLPCTHPYRLPKYRIAKHKYNKSWEQNQINFQDLNYLIRSSWHSGTIVSLQTQLAIGSIPTRENEIFIKKYIYIFFALVSRHISALSSPIQRRNVGNGVSEHWVPSADPCTCGIQREADLI